MASRHPAVISQQQQGAVLPAGKKKIAVGAEGKNRRVLGDIGNLVKVPVAQGKVQPPINRPITRSFGAQLLANAKAAAANKQLPVAIPRDAPVVKVGNQEAAKKINTKPKKAKEVVENISVLEKQPLGSTICSSGKSAKRRVNTLSSVLTARSKVACGITDKPKEKIHDIDAADAQDQLAVADYVEDIYKFYKIAENSFCPQEYMGSQLEINERMREILADWLIEVHHKFELMPETLYLTLHIIDRYLSKEMVRRRELQLVGVSAMLIASKYEEIWAPEVNDFICISDRAYTKEQILFMEKGILNKLEWNLTVPTPYHFLVRFLKAALCDKEMEHMVFFFAELGLMQYSMISYSASMFAASAVYAARCTLRKSPLWSDTLKHHTGFSEDQLLDCTQVLIHSHSAAPVSKLKVVFNKYSSEQFGSVALLSPAIKVMDELLKNFKKVTLKNTDNLILNTD